MVAEGDRAASRDAEYDGADLKFADVVRAAGVGGYPGPAWTHGELCLNVGCRFGVVQDDGWTNCDTLTMDGCDVIQSDYSLLYSIDKFDLVFCPLFLSFVPWPAVPHLVSEMARVAKRRVEILAIDSELTMVQWLGLPETMKWRPEVQAQVFGAQQHPDASIKSAITGERLRALLQSLGVGSIKIKYVQESSQRRLLVTGEKPSK